MAMKKIEMPLIQYFLYAPSNRLLISKFSYNPRCPALSPTGTPPSTATRWLPSTHSTRMM